MRILVISDLHIGKNARTKDLSPYEESKDKDDKLVSSFIEFGQNDILERGKFDYLIIPGDITNQSNLVEYKCASNFLEQLRDKFDISEDKIIFVPGNHDIDWNVFNDSMTLDEKELRKSHKYNSLKDPTLSFSKVVSNNLLEDPYFNVWEFDNVIFVGYNSSWHDDAIQKTHFGEITVLQIEKIKTRFESMDMRNTDKLKIFVLHHHVHQYPTPHPLWKDFSCIQNGHLLIEILSQCSFNFVIHGHRHVPYFHSMNFANYPTINFLCAGSYSSEIPSDIAGLVGNLFHIIEFEDISNCKGKIYSRAYDPVKYKWVESKDNHGIKYKDAFGNEFKYKYILNKCKSELVQLKTNQFKELNDLYNSVPDLEYLQNHVRKTLFADLEKDLNLQYCISSGENAFFLKK